jgi:predicted N-formylglutamate amidohydrolase
MGKFDTFRLVITCEHGGNKVPRTYRSLFKNFKKLLKTHRGADMGALNLAQTMSRSLQAPLFFSETTRLLIDLNRSVGHRDSFSEVSRLLSVNELAVIVENYWRPYRTEVESKIQTWAKTSRPVLHIASHSFTPTLHGKTRQADVAFLYDPRRPGEKKMAESWSHELKKLRPDLRVRRNYPYQGKSDGLMKTLRGNITAKKYIGIELEVNQKFLFKGKFTRSLQNSLISSLTAVIHAPSNHLRRAKK